MMLGHTNHAGFWFTLLVAAGLSSGCMVRGSGYVTATGPDVIIVEEVPPDRIETRGPQRAGYIWITGRWDRRHNDWVWQDGHWEATRRGYRWSQGRWDRRGRGHVWIKGSWRAEGKGHGKGGRGRGHDRD